MRPIILLLLISPRRQASASSRCSGVLGAPPTDVIVLIRNFLWQVAVRKDNLGSFFDKIPAKIQDHIDLQDVPNFGFGFVFGNFSGAGVCNAEADVWLCVRKNSPRPDFTCALNP